MANKKTDKRIVLTGGGTTGHVSVNLALIPLLKREGWDIYYMGSKNGIEKDLISPIEGVKYVSIPTGKLRRYFDFENVKDIFKVIGGIIQSIFKIAKIKPNVVFSKGGFVSVPVLTGAYFNRIPSITHESDLTPGLANRLVQPFVKTVFTNFPDTVKYIKSGKGKFLGPVIRESLLNGDRLRAKSALAIANNKPTILVMGGSLGAKNLNNIVRANLDELLKSYNVIHSCGKDGMDKSIEKDGYYQFEYINEDLRDILALSDIVVSRAGANAIFEFLYYKKPMLLIPLPTNQSRGDQIDNAKSFEKNGYAIMREEEKLDSDSLLSSINDIYNNRQFFIDNMSKVNFDDTVSKIYQEILRVKK